MYNKLNLKFWLKDKEVIFKHFKDDCFYRNDKNKRHIYIDNGGSVLLVAHLDTILPPKLVKKDAIVIKATGLDDRLGCAIAFYLNKIGIKADILLTDNEESGQSTAEYFDILKDYNWICNLDRAGVDYVDYGLGCNDIDIIMEDIGVPHGNGSFSDIYSMDTDIARFNFGVGYQLAHEKGSYAFIADIEKQLDKFIEFYTRCQDTKFTWDKDFEDGSIGYCNFCGNGYGKIVYGYAICEECFLSLVYRNEEY